MLIKKFYINGCSPCMAINKVLKDMQKEGIKLPEIQAVELSSSKKQAKYIMIYELSNIPTLIFYGDDGDEITRLEGYIKREQIEELIK